MTKCINPDVPIGSGMDPIHWSHMTTNERLSFYAEEHDRKLEAFTKKNEEVEKLKQELIEAKNRFKNIFNYLDIALDSIGHQSEVKRAKSIALAGRFEVELMLDNFK